VEAWQLVLAVFFALLPVVLMLDFWGDERLDARGRPRTRDWPFQRSADSLDEEAGHDEYAGAH
jgi:hypothetical protein